MNTEEQAKIFKAMGDVTRLRILSLLPWQPRCEEMYSVGDLVAEIGGSQPNLSRHLHILKEAGLVQCRKRGCNVYYWRVPEAFDRICDCLGPYCGAACRRAGKALAPAAGRVTA